MSRYTGPKCKLCRREGLKLFLKGAKCESLKCPVVVRQSAPGQHGTRRVKVTDFSLQLREKQKAKRIYGINESQSRRYFLRALKDKMGVGEGFLTRLERRLDNVIYRLGFALSRAEARQKILHGKIRISGRLVKRPSYEVKSGEAIIFAKENVVPPAVERILPAWLSYSPDERKASVVSLPQRKQISEDLDEKLIVQFYSR